MTTIFEVLKNRPLNRFALSRWHRSRCGCGGRGMGREAPHSPPPKSTLGRGHFDQDTQRSSVLPGEIYFIMFPHWRDFPEVSGQADSLNISSLCPKILGELSKWQIPGCEWGGWKWARSAHYLSPLHPVRRCHSDPPAGGEESPNNLFLTKACH